MKKIVLILVCLTGCKDPKHIKFTSFNTNDDVKEEIQTSIPDFFKKEGEGESELKDDSSFEHPLYLHAASSLGMYEFIPEMIQSGLDINSQDLNGDTAIHKSIQNGFLRSTEVLIEYGADIHIVNQRGQTALHIASENQFNIIAELLFKNGATVDIEDINGQTPLSIVSNTNNTYLVELFSQPPL